MTMLRTIREKKGLTLSQLAARASIPVRVLAEYEEGRQPLPLTHAKILAKALWVQIEELMPPAGSSPTPTAPPSNPAQVQPQPPRSQNSVQAPPRIAPPPMSAPPPPQPQVYQERNDRKVEAPARQEAHRPHRPGEGESHGVRTAGAKGNGHATRTRPAPPPPGPITEGQLDELSRLAARLEITREQLEERVGKNLSNLTRPEAKDWIKRIRAIAEEIAPTHRVQFGHWPEAEEDREAAYLDEQRAAQSPFLFKLFNGEQFTGTISDFTPYTIVIKLDGTGAEMVLRKLAIAYYRRAPEGQAAAAEGQPAAKASRSRASKAGKAAHSHQPLETGVDSDRAGEPKVPETDSMDEDRGV